ncbi:potassium channel family protein [Halorussus halophilus]|uniref:potassium channel family protein n=1 Tax=Halorussus halophilus TaxID=2650975 RepID=UPI001300D045|nr:TrkA family potassium uptake protein [Halorussus halophilus]
MRLVIVGAGRVGRRTAQILQEEGHDVTVVENDPDKADLARSMGFMVIEGDGASEDILEQTDLETVDAIAGVTGDLNVNYAACMIGKHYGCRTVLRIDEDYREDIYHKFADDVDEVVYPERLGAAGAKTALLGGDFNVIADLTEGLQLTTLTIPERAPIVGQRVSGIELPEDARIYAHGHSRDRLTIPLPGTEIDAGDRLAVIVDQGALPEVKERLLGEATEANI